MNDLELKPLTVIVPVYKGIAETKECLLSLSDGLERLQYTVLLINDCSPEAEVTEFCREFAKNKGVVLIENATNLGFVKSVNIGFQKTADRDVVLLNSDTIVSKDWASRLQAVAYQEDRIATVTPFSNNATICSYPVMREWSEGYDSGFTEYLDGQFFERNGLLWEEIPTAVGFCMYIKRSAIDLVGEFDEQAFGKGYGEECDFCLRLKQKGFQNVAAAGVYVHHQGNVSFGESSVKRKEEAEKIILERYPDYSETVIQFVNRDPLAVYRDKVTLALSDDFPVAGGLIQVYKAAFDESQLSLERSQSNAVSIGEQLKEANVEYINVCDQLALAQTLLQDARSSFAEADASLLEAQKSAEKNSQDMASLTGERDLLLEQYSDAAKENNRLQEHLALIEGSRAWRLIQWIKKILGKQ